MSLIRIRVAGVLRERGKVLLVQHEKNNRRYWLLPGGGVDFGETLEDALKREFEEETRLKVQVGKLLFVNETLAPDGSRHGLHFTFLARKVGGRLKVNRDTRLRDALFVSWPMLKKVSFYPPIAKFLLEAHNRRFTGPPRFLGNLWTP